MRAHINTGIENEIYEAKVSLNNDIWDLRLETYRKIDDLRTRTKSCTKY